MSRARQEESDSRVAWGARTGPIGPSAVGCRDDLADVLTEGQRLGFLGPASVKDQISHALGFVEVVSSPGHFLDLGSGGGLPGLVVGCCWPEARGVLLEAAERRAVFLRQAVRGLGLASRIEVIWARAESAGRDEALRGRSDLVVARAFGPSGVTAECGAPFLARGGRLVVSEPPNSPPGRWPRGMLEVLGLEAERRVQVRRGPRTATYQVLCQRELCPWRFPRRVGVPRKRPLF